MMSDKDKPKILITSGEPAGIGPDLIIQLANVQHDYNITVIGDPELFSQRAELLKCTLNIKCITTSDDAVSSFNKSTLKILPVRLNTNVVPGKLKTENAKYVLEVLDTACRECLAEHYDAVVTTPIQKSIINDAGIAFSGHTEYFAKLCGDYIPVMLLTCPELRVALVTTHLPLKDVSKSITPERLENVLRILMQDMQNKFGMSKPRISVCGLNPHAGENGHLGTEENEIITPVLEKLRKEKFKIIGPLPADTAFRYELRQKTDVYVCMYHDQGLPVLKTLGFGEAVNITLGLPIIRTSVDHGTALELAGTGKSDCDSLIAAINSAEKMVLHKKRILNPIATTNNLAINEY